MGWFVRRVMGFEGRFGFIFVWWREGGIDVEGVLRDLRKVSVRAGFLCEKTMDGVAGFLGKVSGSEKSERSSLVGDLAKSETSLL